MLVAGEDRLGVGCDRVELVGTAQIRNTDAAVTRSLRDAEQQVSRPVLPGMVNHLVERFQPLLGL